MSVLFEGIDKPKYCTKCPCFDGEYSCCNITNTPLPAFEGGPLEDCPAKEIKAPYGKLIDANKLKQAMMASQIVHGIIGTTFGLSDAIRIINDALSVIEAEE